MLNIKPVTRTMGKYHQIVFLYHHSFHISERYSIFYLRQEVKRKHGEFLAYYQDSRFIGFTYSIVYDDMAFLLYIAVNKKLRNKGYGSQILQILKERYQGKTIILNVEDCINPNIENKEKRHHFYLNNGFIDSGYIIKKKYGNYIAMVSKEGKYSVKKYNQLIAVFSRGKRFDNPKLTNKGNIL